MKELAVVVSGSPLASESMLFCSCVSCVQKPYRQCAIPNHLRTRVFEIDLECLLELIELPKLTVKWLLESDEITDRVGRN